MDEQPKKGRKAPLIQTPPIFVDRETAADALNLGVSTFMREVRAGRLPAARLISPNRVGWLWSELVAFATAQPVADLLPPQRCDNRRASN